MISTVDPQARHGHKTAARGSDGHQGDITADPDSEIITVTTGTPSNADAATDLIADLLTAAEPEVVVGTEPDAEAATVYGDNA